VDSGGQLAVAHQHCHKRDSTGDTLPVKPAHHLLHSSVCAANCMLPLTSMPGMQWALPVGTFHDSGYISRPRKAKWARAEASSFVAAGYVW
jgi:hypothetical protein